MKYSLKLEELAQLMIALVAIYHLSPGIHWWLWPVLFLSPDISMIGYLVNARVGAICYNSAHHKAVAAALIIAGWQSQLPLLLLGGLVLWAHAAFDRVLGYGLKYPGSFKQTHLGIIGGKEK